MASKSTHKRRKVDIEQGKDDGRDAGSLQNPVTRQNVSAELIHNEAAPLIPALVPAAISAQFVSFQTVVASYISSERIDMPIDAVSVIGSARSIR